MATKPEEKTAGDYIKEILDELQALRKESNETRVHLNDLTKEVNQQGSAINAKPTSTKAKTGGGGGALQDLAKVIGKGIDFLIKNPDKIFGKEQTPENSIIKANEKLYKEMIKTNLTNSIKLSNLTVEKLQNEVKRAGKTGWNVL